MLNYPKSFVGAKPIAGGEGGNCPDCPNGKYFPLPGKVYQ